MSIEGMLVAAGIVLLALGVVTSRRVVSTGPYAKPAPPSMLRGFQLLTTASYLLGVLALGAAGLVVLAKFSTFPG